MHTPDTSAKALPNWTTKRFPRSLEEAFGRDALEYASAGSVSRATARDNVARDLALGALVVVIVLALFAMASRVHMTDHSAEWGEANRVIKAQQQQDIAERRQRAAQAMCESDGGPQVEAHWVNAYTVECINPRGRSVATFGMEAGNAR